MTLVFFLPVESENELWLSVKGIQMNMFSLMMEQKCVQWRLNVSLCAIFGNLDLTFFVM